MSSAFTGFPNSRPFHPPSQLFSMSSNTVWNAQNGWNEWNGMDRDGWMEGWKNEQLSGTHKILMYQGFKT
jgi:hypothetical protein